MTLFYVRRKENIFVCRLGEMVESFRLLRYSCGFRRQPTVVKQSSNSDFKKDILILAGDVTDDIILLQRVLENLRDRFFQLLYVPGNHDLWVCRDIGVSSLEKLRQLKIIVDNTGVSMEPLHFDLLSIVPLFSWYDYSFGQPSSEILNTWMDCRTCRWPEGFNEKSITRYFISMNETFLEIKKKFIIFFSHFLPRIDLMPHYIPPDKRNLYLVLGSLLLENQIRKLGQIFMFMGIAISIGKYLKAIRCILTMHSGIHMKPK